jgi:hypothetical protein
MNRDEIAALVLSARTLEECDVAEAALRQWMEENPDDFGMQEIGEGLAMMKDALSGADSCPEGQSAQSGSFQTAASGEDPTTEEFGISFEEEVELARAEFGCDVEQARAFVASYRPTPSSPVPAASIAGSPVTSTSQDRGGEAVRPRRRRPAPTRQSSSGAPGSRRDSSPAIPIPPDRD